MKRFGDFIKTEIWTEFADLLQIGIDKSHLQLEVAEDMVRTARIQGRIEAIRVLATFPDAVLSEEEAEDFIARLTQDHE